MPKTLSQEIIVAPFGIEADHPRSCDLMIQSIQNCRLRSAIKPTKEVFSKEEGRQITESAPAGVIKGLPSNLPGMQLHVNPQEGTYMVVDPLADDERTMEKVKKQVDRQSEIQTAGKFRGVDPVEGSVDADRMKTLVRELYTLVKEGHVKVIKGTCPDMEDIEDLPGDFLLNASNLQHWHQPKHEKDLPEWEDRMNRLGSE